jgi:hypothetical protein
MYVRAQSKQRYGEAKECFINIDQIAVVEIGHEGNINLKMSNDEEMMVSGDRAKLLLAWVQDNQLG